jgi:hypothetical protein
LNWFYQFDDWVIASLEKVCHRFQKLTGKTNFWIKGQIGNAQLVLCGVCVVATFISFPQPAPVFFRIYPDKMYIGLLVIIVLTALPFTTVGNWREEEATAFERLEQGLSNPMKVTWFSINLGSIFDRGLCYIFIPSTILTVLLGMSTVFTFMYFSMFVRILLSALDPLPPCKGKIGDWLGSLFLKPISNPQNF